MESVTVRVATLDEIDALVAIDDDASALFVAAGLDVDIAPTHPYAQAERARWVRAIRAGSAYVATDAATDAMLGMLVLARVDGQPYLEQLSVRRTAMRRGLGAQLLHRALSWAEGEALWLTTYAHLPWNRPYYERHGFAVVPESDCDREIVALLDEQRRFLPEPEKRVAMRHPGRDRPSAAP